MQVVQCHIRLLKHLNSTGAIRELVDSVFEEGVQSMCFEDQEARERFEATLQADRMADAARANVDGVTTLCACDDLIGLPITAPSRVCCLTTCCNHDQLQQCVMHGCHMQNQGSEPHAERLCAEDVGTWVYTDMYMYTCMWNSALLLAWHP